MKKTLLFIVLLLTTFCMSNAQIKVLGITKKIVTPTGELGDPHKLPDKPTLEDEAASDDSSQGFEVPNADGVSIYYNYINNGTELEVTFRGMWYGHYNNEYSGTVVIPQEVTVGECTLKVTSIGNSAFSGCHDLTAVTIPNSVTSIGNYAFSDCRSLASVTIPDNVTSIGKWAFNSCSALTSFVIPDSVTVIEDYTFDSCSGLTSIHIPNSITSIGVSAFYGCGHLTSVTIPGNVTSIGDYAFSNCINLASILIPDNVTSIGDYGFAGCRSLASVIIPDSVLKIGNNAFYNCYGLTSVAIGNSVKDIGRWAFYGCTSLSEITLGNSVTNIGELAFSGCTSLSAITIPISLTKIEEQAFYGCSNLSAVYIMDMEAYCNIQFDGDFYRYHHLYLNGEIIRNLTIPEGVTSIGNYAFSKCLGIPSITIPNSVTSIGYETFAFCPGLKDVYCYAEQMPETGGNAFLYSNYEGATLYVPAASVVDYSSAEQWKDFGSIVALTHSSLMPSEVFVPIVTPHTNVTECYDLMGRRLQQTPREGIYIKNGKKYVNKLTR